MAKKCDLAVKTGSYTDRDGNEKGRYINVGSIVETKNGGEVILLNRTFNPAGVPNPDNSDVIFVSMFAPKDKPAPSAAPVTEHSAAKANAFVDDDIAF